MDEYQMLLNTEPSLYSPQIWLLNQRKKTTDDYGDTPEPQTLSLTEVWARVSRVPGNRK